MNITNLFRKKPPVTVDKVILSQMCKAKLSELLNSPESDDMISLMVAYEIETSKGKKETYQFTGGMEPSQAIYNLDQWHHRIQHEGVAHYD